jgi:phosphatidylglycerophosphatase C
MSTGDAAHALPCIAVFDLDGTLTRRDTLLPYVLGFALRHPWRILGLWRVVAALCAFIAGQPDRGILKSRFIRALMGGAARQQVEAWSETFVAALERRGAFRRAGLAALDAHRASGHHLILMSASPDLYVPLIGRRLGFERTLCTGIRWRKTPAGAERLDGALLTANRRGLEKSRCLKWLREQYPGMAVVAYGNSASDLPHMMEADRALLVNGNARARRLAEAHGIPVGDWQ